MNGVYTDWEPSKRFQRLFNSYNRKYFNGAIGPTEVGLASLLNLRLEKNSGKRKKWRIDGSYGEAFVTEDGAQHIVLDRAIAKSDFKASALTLLHEMVHLFVGSQYGHGPRFRKEIRRIAAMGAVDGLV